MRGRILVSLVAFPSIAFAAPPSARVLASLNGGTGSTTSQEGTNYDFKTGGFGIDASFSPRGLLGDLLDWDSEPSLIDYIHPIFGATIDANIVSAEDPCMSSPFDPNTQICETISDPVRVFGAGKLGLRAVLPSGDVPGPLGLTLGVQYLLHGVFVTSTDGIGDDNAPLLYGQLEYTSTDWMVTLAAGQGRFAMFEYGFQKEDLPLVRAIALRVEYMDWKRSESIIGTFNVHVMAGLLDF